MILRILVATFLITNLVQAIVPIADVQDLVAVVQIFRYGEKTPDLHYEADPWKDKIAARLGVGPGQLTLNGKRKVFELGQFTRQRYEAFLPPLYNETWFKAYSTDDDVTLTSSESYLSAFFWPKIGERFIPDLPWQPIPVHPVPEEILRKLPKCPSYWTEIHNVLQTDRLFRAVNSEYAETYDYIQNHTGLECTVGMKALKIYDIIHIENHHKLELPLWAKSIYPQPLSFIAETSFKALTHTDQMKRIYAGPWLHTVFNSFINILEDPTSYPKFQVYTAHDLNLGAIFRTLGTSEAFSWIPFASSFFFELRKSRGVPVISIWYKNDKLGFFKQLDVKGCGYQCSIGAFGKALRKYFVDVETWKEECSIKQPVVQTTVDKISYYKDIIRKTAFRSLSQANQ